MQTDTMQPAKSSGTFNIGGDLPVVRLGSVLCARRSVRVNWIARQENRVSPPGS